MPGLGTARSSARLAALLLALAVAVLGAAGPAAAKQRRLSTGIHGDGDAKLSMVLQTSRSGEPKRIKGLKATGYDLACSRLGGSDVEAVVEVDFSFPAIEVDRARKGGYRYSFSGRAGDEDPFSTDFHLHTGTAKGWFATGRSGRPTKLVGYLAMGGVSNRVPGIQGAASCSDPVRKDRFEKLHGSFAVPLR